MQLPPSLYFEAKVTEKFLDQLRHIYEGPIAWEPRHISWACEEAVALLATYHISKVEADPERCPVEPEQQARVERIRYFRMHGAPQIYKSRYSINVIDNLFEKMRASTVPAWCIFDNTTYGFATENALELQNRMTARAESAELFL